MRFLVLILTFIVQRRFKVSLSRHLDQLCRESQQQLANLLPKQPYAGWLLFGLSVILPVLLTGFLFWFLDDILFGLFGFFLQVVLLFCVFGCPFLKQQLDHYLQAWEERDFQAAYLHAKQIGYHLDVGVSQPAQLNRQVRNEFLMQTFGRYFSVIFWFMLGGPAAALAARLVNQAAEDGATPALRKAARPVDLLMQWVPVRLLALTFALAGNVAGCMKVSGKLWLQPLASPRGMLIKAADGALLGNEAPPKDVQPQRDIEHLLLLRDLLSRSIALWFGILAVLVLLEWSL